MHRWAGIQDGRFTTTQLKSKVENDNCFATSRINITNTNVLIIDEISMIPSHIYDQVNFICQTVRDSVLPMGGIQVIAIGDFYQLRPVANKYSNDTGECVQSSHASCRSSTTG